MEDFYERIIQMQDERIQAQKFYIERLLKLVESGQRTARAPQEIEQSLVDLVALNLRKLSEKDISINLKRPYPALSSLLTLLIGVLDSSECAYKILTGGIVRHRFKEKMIAENYSIVLERIFDMVFDYLKPIALSACKEMQSSEDPTYHNLMILKNDKNKKRLERDLYFYMKHASDT